VEKEKKESDCLSKDFCPEVVSEVDIT
jgi:hypothetical protein